MDKAVQARDVETLTWRDIEALPYYVGSAIIIWMFTMGLSEVGPELRVAAAKAALFFALIGVRFAFLHEEKA